MKKIRKKLKGMTLVEIIIALFVFTVAAALMVRIGTVIATMNINSNHVNRRVSIQAPYADNADPDATDVITSEGEIKVTINYQGHPVKVVGQKYSTKNAVDPTDPLTNGVNYDLSFVDIQVAGEGETSANIWVEPTT
ncbi:MAG: prepilin-type N-terminal cleavage/methylation domain-containing protein [Oscillospiraceae bacterium]|nr:prepilin-type N-terminal cleavage/methylation domain-containing protein [Oscillospiraceae bacterium]